MTFKYRISDSINLCQGVDQSRDQKLYTRGIVQTETANLLLSKLNRLPGLILGDEVGMGKTWIALMAALAVAEQDGTVLVIAPSGVLARQWESQYRDLVHQKLTPGHDREKFLNYLKVYRREPYKELLQDARRRRTDTRIFVTSIGWIDQNLDSRLRALDPPPFDFVIIDEGHNFKNENTRRYQAFHKRENDTDSRPPVLYRQFRRALLLTATPFQLGHHELRGVLRIFEAAAFEGNMDGYIKETFELISTLDSYQKLLARFERRWATLDSTDVDSLLAVVGSGVEPTSIKVSDACDVLKQMLKTKADVNRRLLNVIVRNVKGDAHRQPRDWGISLERDKQLLFFLSERLDHAVRRSPNKVRGHLHALPSSFGRYEEHLKIASECGDAAVKHYVDVCSKLFLEIYRNEAHPKLDKVADSVFEGWMRGEKSIVFCGFLDTVKEFRAALERRAAQFVNELKGKVREIHPDHEKIVERLRRARNIESLLTGDNAIQTSLRPLVECDSSESGKLLELSEQDLPDLASFLLKLRFDPDNINYRKLLGALECLFFNRFLRQLPERVPPSLKDDFEYYCNIEKIANHLSRNVASDDTEAPASLEAIQAFLLKAHGSGRLTEVLRYPSIWRRFSKELESITVEQRIDLSEIVSHYLTSDEFLYLSLLPNIGPGDLDANALAHKIWDVETAGEPIGRRVQRFIVHSSKLEKKSLEGLIADMGERYKGYRKTNASEAIIEVVTGGDDLDKKLRTVTAFKAPFAPYILVSTNVLSEGVDLHTECRTVYHYDHEWNPATLEQKNGRVDRVGSRAERDGTVVLLNYPFLKGTQDQKAREVVKARASWFNTVMGKDFGSELREQELDNDIVALPDELRRLLIMRLDNDAHRDFEIEEEANEESIPIAAAQVK